MKAEAEKCNRLTCAVEATLQVIDGRCKVLIFTELLQGVKRFGELHKIYSRKT